MTLKVGCGQFCASANVSKNFSIIKKLVYKSLNANIKVLFLPEASDYLAKNAQHSFQLSMTSKELLITPLQQEIKKIYDSIESLDNDKGIFISLGVHEPDTNSGKTKNKLLWIDNKGDIVHEYQKIHLFDVNIKNGPILKESNSVLPGKSILSPFSISEKLGDYKVGLQICYDIRFPELSLKLFKMGANILTFPSAFTVKTGESHWQNLGRTRAIDNQSYVIMAAQCGEHRLIDDKDDSGDVTKRVSYGNSIIIDPWGDIVAQGSKYNDSHSHDEDGDYYEMIEAELDLEFIDKIRTNMPLLSHRSELDN